MSNILSEVHPELVAEWSDKNLPLTPDRITYGSNKVVWWKGACGHEWQTSVKARSNGENCPICSGARVIEGINDLATQKPELADEWSSKNAPLKPTMVTTGSHKKVIWRDKYGHEWTATVKSRALNGTGCPYCSHNKILVGFNDLASQHPQIASEWSERNYPLKPDMVTVFANRKVWWRCSKGHEWNTLISTRSGGSGCPYCSGQLLLKGFNDFATTHPQLAQEWSDRNLPLAPDMINEKSRRNVWWKCRECGYEWQSVVYARVKGTVCPVCADRAVMAGYNDLATTDAHLLSEWDYEKNKNISPNKISRHSMQSVWWKCSLGHSWKAKISERAIEGKGCKVCEKDYLTVFPKLAVMYYAAKKRIKVQTDTDKIIGIPLEIYLPEEKAAIETVSGTENVETLKAYLCRKREIKLIKIPYTLGNSEIDFAMKIKKAFRSLHIFITSNEDEDTAFIRQRFFEWRKEYLAELLADENNSLWSQVLYGITGTDDQIVTVALSQIGTMGGDPYWSWYGFNSRVEWCACFVSWCANECGYIDAGVIPKYAGCVNGVQWFKDRGQWLDNSAEPTPGMIIFFDWADESGQDGLSDHTGIVQKVENGRVYTVEGNSGDSVRQNSYPVGYYEILGYGAPAY